MHLLREIISSITSLVLKVSQCPRGKNLFIFARVLLLGFYVNESFFSPFFFFLSGLFHSAQIFIDSSALLCVAKVHSFFISIAER